MPRADTAPRFTLDMADPVRLSSDGGYFTAAPCEGQEVFIWRVDDLERGNAPFRVGGRGGNLPGDAMAAQGRLYVADRSNNRVQVWNRVQDALDGRPADAFLGGSDGNDIRAGLGADKLFMPGALAFDGSNLWVAEFKFSTRILRFSAQPLP